MQIAFVVCSRPRFESFSSGVARYQQSKFQLGYDARTPYHEFLEDP